MADLRIMVCHPGHTFSTSDVYDGLCAGLALNGVEVINFEWGKMLQPLSALIVGAVAGGVVRADKADTAQQFAGWLASADALTVAFEREVHAVVVVNGLLFPPSRALVLRKTGIPVACYGTEAPYFLATEREIAPAYTHWFTNERRCVEAFSDLALASYLPMAYNPAIHMPGSVDLDKTCDAVFVGGGYPERKALLAGGFDGLHLETRGTLWHLDLDGERDAADYQRKARYSEGAIPNSETCAWHRSATIALNLHRRMTFVERPGETVPPGAAESLGPRAYEISAVGGFQLIDDERPEVWDVFKEAAATFRAWDRSDLERQLRYWLAHPDARERTRHAQQEAAAPHHWGNRARTLLEHLIA